MGRDAMITHEQVAAVADAMKAAGGKPTSRSIRERLGNVGSMGTINKMLQHWKAGQERQTVTALVLPLALQRAILDFMDQELTMARAALEADLAEQQRETADLATENERQIETIEGQAEQLNIQAAEKAAAEGRATQLAVDLDSAREDAARERHAAELARTELAKAVLRLEAMPRLEGDLAAIRAELEKERKARVEAEQAAAVLAAQKTDLDGRVAEARAQANKLGEQLEKMQERAEKLAADLADARVAVQSSQARIDVMGHEVKDARKDAEKARSEAKAAGEQAAELRGKLG